MGQLTNEAIALIKANNKLFFEVQEEWQIHRGTLYRWLLDNRRPQLSHPRTTGIIERYNEEQIQILATKEP